MNHENDVKKTSAEDRFKQLIENEEIVLKTETLEARRQVAKQIIEAQNIAEQDYSAELEKLEKLRKDLITQTETKFKALMNDLERIENEAFQEISEKYELRKKEAIDKLLETITP
ncbi:MAG: hypothetical protein ACFE8U_05190 [Candidatus Hermodarchaeota archaeon]